jgi:hypothetical protein
MRQGVAVVVLQLVTACGFNSLTGADIEWAR